MSRYATRSFPSRIAELGFSVNLPPDWQVKELPQQEPNFDDGSFLFGLAAVVAPYAPMVFAATARPAWDSGTVHDWAHWMCQQHEVSLGLPMQAGHLGSLPAIVGMARSESDVGPMLTWFAFAEDGQRLLHVSLTAPEPLAAIAEPAWAEVLGSFALETPRGPTVALTPEQTPAANEPTPPATLQPTVATPQSRTPPTGMARFALSGGLATLLQDDPINQNLLGQGRGFVPRLLSSDEASRTARVGSMALMAELELPFGWHPLDDSRSLLLLDPSGEVQVRLEFLESPDGTAEALLDLLEAHARRDYPAPEFLRMAHGPVQVLGVRNIHDGDTELQQFHLLIPPPVRDDAGRLVRARVTAVPARAGWAVDFGEALLLSLAPLQPLRRAA